VSEGSRCEQHKRMQEQRRGSAASRGYDDAWRKARAAYLYRHPLCVHCTEAGKVTAATELDHKVPHRGDRVLFWDRSNWQGLCKPHHSSKTATEDSAWAHKG